MGADDLRSGRTNSRCERVDIDLRPQRADTRPQRANFRTKRVVFRCERTDFRSEGTDFRPERTDLKSERSDRETNGQMARGISECPPVFYRTSSPLGLLPRNSKMAFDACSVVDF